MHIVTTCHGDIQIGDVRQRGVSDDVRRVGREKGNDRGGSEDIEEMIVRVIA